MGTAAEDVQSFADGRRSRCGVLRCASEPGAPWVLRSPRYLSGSKGQSITTNRGLCVPLDSQSSPRPRPGPPGSFASPSAAASPASFSPRAPPQTPASPPASSTPAQTPRTPDPPFVTLPPGDLCHPGARSGIIPAAPSSTGCSRVPPELARTAVQSSSQGGTFDCLRCGCRAGSASGGKRSVDRGLWVKSVDC